MNRLSQALKSIFISCLFFILLSISSYAENDRSEDFRLALIQMYVQPGEKETNLKRAVRLIQEAAGNGANVVLLPEAMDLGWTHPSALSEAERIPGGRTCKVLSEAARKNNVFICSGVIEKDGDIVYNSAVIIDNKGKILIKHRKIYELSIAHDIYNPGDRLNVCKTPFGTFGLLICADAVAKDLALLRSLCYMGADVILSPSSWAMPPDHDNIKNPYGDTWRNAYIPAAKEFSVWIAGCSNVGPVTAGPWKNYNGIGCSLVIDPYGSEIVQGPYGKKAETIIYVDINPIKRPTWGTGWAKYKPLQK